MWSEPAPPDDTCYYHHTRAQTPFGDFLLTWKGWKDKPDYGFDETPWCLFGGEYHGWNSIQEAQDWAEKEMGRRVGLLLQEQEKSS